MSVNLSFIDKLRFRLNKLEHKLLQYRLSTNECVVTETEYGKVKGSKRMSVYDDAYYSFEGIPYAQPPVGELRFKAPQRPTPWEGVRDCTQPANVAVQYIIGKVEGSEDCLYLNVFTNNLNPETPRPVLVWIHGGGFIFGDATRDSYGPDYFMKKDIVLVTVQYRLGYLGFLSLKDPELNVPGNAGLKDQVMALKWVKNNCASFGGNPDCITVFGESAGGASSHYMTLTPQTQGLFHRAILQSGNSFSNWALVDCANIAIRLAKLGGYKGEEKDKDVLEFLQKAKAKDLIKLEQLTVSPEEHRERPKFAFGPVVEPYETPECVIPKHPRDLAKNAWSNSMPIMMEYKQNPACINDLETCVNFVPSELADAERTSTETIAKGLILKKAHVAGEKPTLDEFFDIISHACFWHSANRLIQSRFAHASGASTFLYRFNFDSDQLLNIYRVLFGLRGTKGVAHGDELNYLFWNFMARRVPKNSREYRTIERTVDIWTQFATTGNPNNEKINGMDAITWEPLKKSDEVYKCLDISDELKFIDLPEMQKLKVWESLYENNKDLF